MHILAAAVFFLWHRVHDDFWPWDRSFVGPNLVASVVQALTVAGVAYLVWPRLRERVNTWVRGHLHAHHLAHVAPHHDIITTSLEDLRRTVARIELRLGSSYAGHYVPPLSLSVPPNQPPHKEPTMSLITTVEDLATEAEKRFAHHPPLTDLVSAAHDEVRAIMAKAATDIGSVALSVAPAGREISLFLTALEEASSWVHAHIARNQTSPAPTDTPAAAAPAPVVDVPAAPVVEPAPAEVPAAPAADPGVTQGVPAPTDTPAPGAVVDTSTTPTA